jgi:hypothetical protein
LPHNEQRFIFYSLPLFSLAAAAAAAAASALTVFKARKFLA